MSADDNLDEWIAGNEEAAHTVLASTHPGVTDAIKRHAEISLRHMRTLRDAIPKAARYEEVCASNSENAKSPTKKLRTRQRNMDMAREFKKRTMRRDVYGGKASDIALMTEVGRLPRFNLKRNAAYNGITDGLAQLEKLNSSSQRRKVD
jgi:hypothetical protein